MLTLCYVQGSDSQALKVHSDNSQSETSSGSLGTIVRNSLFPDCCLQSAAEELWSLECVEPGHRGQQEEQDVAALTHWEGDSSTAAETQRVKTKI